VRVMHAWIGGNIKLGLGNKWCEGLNWLRIVSNGKLL
jgi:hypothetical protein